MSKLECCQESAGGGTGAGRRPSAVFSSKTKEQVEASCVGVLATTCCTRTTRGMGGSSVQWALAPPGPAQHTLAYDSSCV